MGFDVIDGELWDVETGEYAGPASGWIKGDESPEDLTPGDAEAHGHRGKHHG